MTDPSTVRFGIVGLGNIARIHRDTLESQGLGDTAEPLPREVRRRATGGQPRRAGPEATHRRPGRRAIPNRGSWFTLADVADGGTLIDIGVHAIDLSRYLLGDPDVIEVPGTTRSEFGSWPDGSSRPGPPSESSNSAVAVKKALIRRV